MNWMAPEVLERPYPCVEHDVQHVYYSTNSSNV
jgi:hypothetical protein